LFTQWRCVAEQYHLLFVFLQFQFRDIYMYIRPYTPL